MALHKLKIDEKGIWLDEMLLQGVRAYAVTHEENEDIDELTLLMDTTSSNIGSADFNALLDENGKRVNSDF